MVRPQVHNIKSFNTAKMIGALLIPIQSFVRICEKERLRYIALGCKEVRNAREKTTAILIDALTVNIYIPFLKKIYNMRVKMLIMTLVVPLSAASNTEQPTVKTAVSESLSSQFSYFLSYCMWN